MCMCLSEVSIPDSRAWVLSFRKCKANTFCFWESKKKRPTSSCLGHPCLSPFLSHSPPISPSLCTSAKVISSIDSYHQLVNWSITPAPHLLNAGLINYCRPRGWEWGGCHREFSRLRWIFIVFVPWSVRAHQLVLKHGEFREAKMGWVPLNWHQMCTGGCVPYILYVTGFTIASLFGLLV